MKRDHLTLALGIGAILLTAQGLRAQDAQCAERSLIVERLAEEYGESRQSLGLTGSGQLLEVFASPETGTWTITVTTANGLACLVAAGEAFRRIEGPLAPVALGEPV